MVVKVAFFGDFGGKNPSCFVRIYVSPTCIFMGGVLHSVLLFESPSLYVLNSDFKQQTLETVGGLKSNRL